MCLSATFLYYKDTMRDCVKGLSKVEVKTIHFSSLILRAHPLLTESNQVGIARFNLGKSNLGFQSPSCPSCVWKWLPWRIPPAISQARGKTDQSVPPCFFFCRWEKQLPFFSSLQGTPNCHSLSKVIESGLGMKLANSRSTMQNMYQRIKSIITFSKGAQKYLSP